MKTKLKINEHCSIRVQDSLYCLSDLYHFMDMRNDRSSPQAWAADRAGVLLDRKGFFRKTYWADAFILADYAESLTPGIAKEVRAALGIPRIPTTEDVHKMIVTRSRPLVSPEASELPVRRISDDRYRRNREVEANIRNLQRQPATRGQRSSSTRSHSTSRHDDMMTRALLTNQIMSESYSSRKHSSGFSDTCHAPSRSHVDSTPSHHHYDSTPSDYGSYDSGSSGCD